MTTHSILIVDDDSILRDSMGALLEGPESNIFFAANGSEALHLAGQILPDVIVLDIMMPDMDGYEVCRRLRADPTLAEVPILMVTALDDRESRLRGLEAGADDFLSKPIDRIELRTRIRTITRLNRFRKLVEERVRFAETLEVKNRQLLELSQHLIEIQESERRFLATELHDDLGQMLTGLKLMIEMAATQSGDERQKTLKNSKDVITDLSDQVRNMSLDLRPAMLDDFGLFSALEWLFGRFTQQSKIAVRHNFSFLETRRFSKQIETAGFRIIQESLTNVARHTQVSEVDVNIAVADDFLKIEIKDYGKGFDASQFDKLMYQSGGLSGMRERASWLGGALRVSSDLGKGTVISATFPLIGGHR